MHSARVIDASNDSGVHMTQSMLYDCRPIVVYSHEGFNLPGAYHYDGFVLLMADNRCTQAVYAGG